MLVAGRLGILGIWSSYISSNPDPARPENIWPLLIGWFLSPDFLEYSARGDFGRSTESVRFHMTPGSKSILLSADYLPRFELTAPEVNFHRIFPPPSCSPIFSPSSFSVNLFLTVIFQVLWQNFHAQKLYIVKYNKIHKAFQIFRLNIVKWWYFIYLRSVFGEH